MSATLHRNVEHAVAAGPKEKLYIDPRVGWTNDRAFGARNWQRNGYVGLSFSLKDIPLGR